MWDAHARHRPAGLSFPGWVAAACAACLLAGCGGSSNTSIRIDGSSTVYPISLAANEVFRQEHPEARISVSRSGTGAGMGKFLLGEIDICDASRPIKQAEIDQAQRAGVEYLEFTIALDGLAIVANPQNDWCDSITVDQLKAIWRPEADERITHWKQVDETWADEPLTLFGPGTASGTFEFFTQVICGEKNASRSDFQKSEDDNMLVRGVAGTKGGLGYFGYAYYVANQDKLKLLAVDNGTGPVRPSVETVMEGAYLPLSRPLLIYVNKKALERPQVAEFVRFYVENAPQIAVDAQYVAASESAQQQNAQLLKSIP